MWYSLPFVWPSDGQTVWVRRYFYGDPFQATFAVASQDFTTSDGYVLPWWFVSRWRSL